jgi:hypothetical protein
LGPALVQARIQEFDENVGSPEEWLQFTPISTKSPSRRIVGMRAAVVRIYLIPDSSCAGVNPSARAIFTILSKLTFLSPRSIPPI